MAAKLSMQYRNKKYAKVSSGMLIRLGIIRDKKLGSLALFVSCVIWSNELVGGFCEFT